MGTIRKITQSDKLNVRFHAADDTILHQVTRNKTVSLDIENPQNVRIEMGIAGRGYNGLKDIVINPADITHIGGDAVELNAQDLIVALDDYFFD